MTSTLYLDFTKKKHKVYWSDDIVPFTKVPFCVVGAKVLDCQHGKDRNVKLKIKNKKSVLVGLLLKFDFLIDLKALDLQEFGLSSCTVVMRITCIFLKIMIILMKLARNCETCKISSR